MPGRDRISCVLCTVLRVGTRRWERVCDQPRRHIGQLQRKGDFVRRATYVEFLSLLELLGGAPCLASEGPTRAPISDGISLASLRQLADRSIDWLIV